MCRQVRVSVGVDDSVCVSVNGSARVNDSARFDVSINDSFRVQFNGSITLKLMLGLGLGSGLVLVLVLQ